MLAMDAGLGTSEMEQINRVCSSPSPENLTDTHRLPRYGKLRPQRHRRRLREDFVLFPDESVDLIDTMLTLDRNK